MSSSAKCSKSNAAVSTNDVKLQFATKGKEVPQKKGKEEPQKKGLQTGANGELLTVEDQARQRHHKTPEEKIKIYTDNLKKLAKQAKAETDKDKLDEIVNQMNKMTNEIIKAKAEAATKNIKFDTDEYASVLSAITADIKKHSYSKATADSQRGHLHGYAMNMMTQMNAVNGNVDAMANVAKQAGDGVNFMTALMRMSNMTVHEKKKELAGDNDDFN